MKFQAVGAVAARLLFFVCGLTGPVLAGPPDKSLMRLFSQPHEIQERMAELLTETYGTDQPMLCRGLNLVAGHPPRWGFASDVRWRDIEITPFDFELSDEHGPLVAEKTLRLPSQVFFVHVRRPEGSDPALPPAPRIWLQGFKWIAEGDAAITRLMFHNDGDTTLRFKASINQPRAVPTGFKDAVSGRTIPLASALKVMDSRKGGAWTDPTGPIDYVLAPREGAVLKAAFVIAPDNEGGERKVGEVLRELAMNEAYASPARYYDVFETNLPYFDCDDPAMVKAYYERAAAFGRDVVDKEIESLAPGLIAMKKRRNGRLEISPLRNASKLQYFMLDGIRGAYDPKAKRFRSVSIVWAVEGTRLVFGGSRTRREILPGGVKPGFTVYIDGKEAGHSGKLETLLGGRR